MKGKGRIVKEVKEKYILLKLEGSFNSYEHDEEIRETFREISKEEPVNVIVDFKEVFYFNSTAIRGLLSGNAFIKRAEGRIIFCNLSDYIANIFKITNLHLTFKILDSLEDAEFELENPTED
jgi:anti-anti-sigma factor